ncbi:unnamed protein product [Linum tenue]|uniref:BHLH domain-containing protein n=1 Tax=Linum tenue TaxID=586396 RepID=A0AAV0IBX6_9ROSI|nr:unnamed protein product [Linum tenue]
MQPCSREMAAGGLNSPTTTTPSHQFQLHDLHQIHGGHHTHHFDPSSASADDFLDQILSSAASSPWSSAAAADLIKSPWADLAAGDSTHDDNNNGFFNDDPAAINLASKFRHHQINGGATNNNDNKMMLQQQLLMASAAAAAAGDGAPLSLFNGFGSGSIQPQQHFHHPATQGPGGGAMQPGQSFGAGGGQSGAAASPGKAQPQASGSTGGAATASQGKPRVRARRGQATDPHSIAERLRRERIAERMKSLQELVPNANKTDKASMLDEIIDYVKFLQLQVKVLSMSRLGGAGAIAPLVTNDMSSEGGGGDCIQANGGSNPANGGGSESSMTMTEQQVAKLMEEDMGSAMQYLQGKGLCLMPISLATAISTATCRNQPSSPNLSVLTGGDVAVKDSTSATKP